MSKKRSFSFKFAFASICSSRKNETTDGAPSISTNNGTPTCKASLQSNKCATVIPTTISMTKFHNFNQMKVTSTMQNNDNIKNATKRKQKSTKQSTHTTTRNVFGNIRSINICSNVHSLKRNIENCCRAIKSRIANNNDTNNANIDSCTNEIVYVIDNKPDNTTTSVCDDDINIVDEKDIIDRSYGQKKDLYQSVPMVAIAQHEDNVNIDININSEKYNNSGPSTFNDDGNFILNSDAPKNDKYNLKNVCCLFNSIMIVCVCCLMFRCVRSCVL